MNLGEEFFHGKILILEHPQRQVDDAHMNVTPLQVFGDGRKTHRVHLENRRGRNQVADGSEKDGELAEVINRRRMEEDEIRFGEHCSARTSQKTINNRRAASQLKADGNG